MKLFAIAGKPVAHSMSPAIHNRWFEKLNINARYLRLHSLNVQHAIEFAKNLGICGLNITSPYKELFLNLSIANQEAVSIGAVNTAIFDNNIITSSNTDFIGVAATIEKHLTNHDRSKISAVILGSSGAAKAATYGLISKLNLQTTVLARNASDQKHFESFGARFCNLNSNEANDVFNGADIIVSTLPSDVILPNNFTFKPTSLLLDAVYKKESNVHKTAIKFGIKVINGLEWLFEQAKPAFKTFTGFDAPEDTSHFLTNFSLNKKPIILIGMMGSGKSSVANCLSQRNFKTVDLDQEIEKTSGMSIADIFKSYGESHFRQLEINALTEAINCKYDVISCGGGITLLPEAQNLLANNYTVWLWASVSELAQRLQNQHIDRPLLSQTSTNLDSLQLSDRVKKIYEDRFSSYAKSSSIILDSQAMTVEQLATEIINEADIS